MSLLKLCSIIYECLSQLEQECLLMALWKQVSCCELPVKRATWQGTVGVLCDFRVPPIDSQWEVHKATKKWILPTTCRSWGANYFLVKPPDETMPWWGDLDFSLVRPWTEDPAKHAGLLTHRNCEIKAWCFKSLHLWWFAPWHRKLICCTCA